MLNCHAEGGWLPTGHRVLGEIQKNDRRNGENDTDYHCHLLNFGRYSRLQVDAMIRQTLNG
jgi:hypothetical protein